MYFLIYTHFHVLFSNSFLIVKPLWWGLLGFHPFILYFGLFSCGAYNYFYNFGWTLSNISLIQILNFCFIALLSGSFWSLMNLVWGFFWVNDVIELLLGLLCFFILIWQHQRVCLFSYLDSLVVFIIICISFLLLRFGFFTTRHSFFVMGTYNYYILVGFLVLMHTVLLERHSLVIFYFFPLSFIFVSFYNWYNCVLLYFFVLFWVSWHSISKLLVHIILFLLFLLVIVHNAGYNFFYLNISSISFDFFIGCFSFFEDFFLNALIFSFLTSTLNLLNFNKVFFFGDVGFCYYNYNNFFFSIS